MATEVREITFDTFAAYGAAAAELMALCERELLIFDTDLSSMALDSRPGIERLLRIVRPNRQICLKIALHRFDWIERAAPRLLTLFQDYSHAIAVRRTPSDLQHLTATFAIGDDRHFLTRFHCDHARGKLLLHQAEQAEPWRGRFDELWQRCGEPLALSRLGL